MNRKVLVLAVSASIAALTGCSADADSESSNLGQSSAAVTEPVNGCTSYTDLTEVGGDAGASGDAAAAEAGDSQRVIDWGFGVARSPNRCITVKVGQSVTFLGSLSSHPLAPKGGDTPNPIPNLRSGSSVTVKFDAPGTFGYVCTRHSSMTGAVRVVN